MYYGLLRIQHFFEALYQSIISLIRVVLRFRFRSDVTHLPFADCTSKESDHMSPVTSQLFILANGPSLRISFDKHIEKLKDQSLLVVNQFVLTEAYSRLKPQYYILLDIGFFLDKTIPRVIEVREKLIEAFIAKTGWPVTLFLPAEGKGSKMHSLLRESGKPFKFVFFNRTVVDGLKPIRHWLYRKNLGMPPPQNVLIGALMVALSGGCREITILGADHSWHQGLEVGEDGKLTSAENHFYDPKPWKVAVHHPETLCQAGIHDYFFNLYRTFRSYHLIRSFADSLNATIINASETSFIDAFERKGMENYPWAERADK